LHHPDYSGAGGAAAVRAYDAVHGGGGVDGMGASSTASPSMSSGVIAGAPIDNALHAEVLNAFSDAAARNPRDADLFNVIGVLNHLSGDYAASVAAFANATALRPDDAALWNRLGATLANSSRSGEAVAAYQKALTLRPRHARALANLAIAFGNQVRIVGICILRFSGRVVIFLFLDQNVLRLATAASSSAALFSLSHNRPRFPFSSGPA
jgi:tetratricopeptide (TPR) repeat protein